MVNDNLNLKIIFIENSNYIQCEKAQKYLLEKTKENANNNFLIITEHLPTITYGKNKIESDLLKDDEFLKSKNISLVSTSRGGKITYHGKGQLVFYPILNLKNFFMGAKGYVENLLETGVKTLSRFDINSYNKSDMPGIFVMQNNLEEKIGFIGVQISKYCTMHGMSINIYNECLENFSYMNPCGYQNLQVTSLEKILNKKISYKDFIQIYIEEFLKNFNFKNFEIKGIDIKI